MVDPHKTKLDSFKGSHISPRNVTSKVPSLNFKDLHNTTSLE